MAIISRTNKDKLYNNETSIRLVGLGCISGGLTTFVIMSIVYHYSSYCSKGGYSHTIVSYEDIPKHRDSSFIRGASDLANLNFRAEIPRDVLGDDHGNLEGEGGGEAHDEFANKGRMPMDEVISFIDHFISSLHQKFAGQQRKEYDAIWKIYHDYALEVLYPWDREYLERMPPLRNDNSIFLSLASYRDENCMNTLKWAYEKAKNPRLLNVGLVQQNCEENCRSGKINDSEVTEPIDPDDDCHKIFCESPIGREHCNAGRVRALHINESESLGPYAARYFGSKLWDGEEYYVQMDAHMTFMQDWDEITIKSLKMAPSEKPILSHYPPNHTADLEENKRKGLVNRLCGAYFADSGLEDQIIRLGGDSGDAFGPYSDIPRFAPFAGAGFFVASSAFLKEVPYDPFLPWIFMGEEIIMSARLWTSGYDIFSPRISVVGHIYLRLNKPKFWESVERLFHSGIHTPLQLLVLQRIKAQIIYPESTPDLVKPKTVLSHVDKYSMGTKRKLEDYFKMVGLDMVNKQFIHRDMDWCYKGAVAPGYEKYSYLYPPENYNTDYLLPEDFI